MFCLDEPDPSCVNLLVAKCTERITVINCYSVCSQQKCVSRFCTFSGSSQDTNNSASTQLRKRCSIWRAAKVDSCLYFYQSNLLSENKHRKWQCCLGSHPRWEQHLSITHLVHQKERKISQRWSQGNMSSRSLKSGKSVHLVPFTKMFICLYVFFNIKSF